MICEQCKQAITVERGKSFDEQFHREVIPIRRMTGVGMVCDQRFYHLACWTIRKRLDKAAKILSQRLAEIEEATNV